MRAHPNSMGVECLLTTSRAGHNTRAAGDTDDEAADDNPDDAEFDPYDDALEHASQDIFDMLTVSDEDDFEGF